MESNIRYSRAESISSGFRLLDVLIVVFSGLLVHYIKFGEVFIEGRFQIFLIVLLFFTTTVFHWFSIYQAWRGQSLFKELSLVTIAWIIVTLAVSTLTFLTKTGQDYSRLWVGWTFVSSYIGLVTYRVGVRAALRHTRKLGFNHKLIVIVGAGTLGQRACAALQKQDWAGLDPIAFFDDNKELVGQTHHNVEVIGSVDDVVGFVEEQRKKVGEFGNAIDQVWIALPLTSAKRIEELQTALLDTATKVYFIPDLFGFNLTSYSVDEVAGLPVMNMSAPTMQGGRKLVKRLEDIIVSGLMLVLLSPLLIIVAALIKLESPGPVLFKQRRYGQDGKEILVWKFRSMTVTEDGDDIKQAQKGDARITKIGAWIRKLSIDELPQLFNVLQGRMSLVGPRPHAVAHNEYYRSKVSGYMARHQIRPGITGWAQVNGSRGETVEIADMEERIRYDLEYIRNWSILMDIRILFRTIGAVANIKDTY